MADTNIPCAPLVEQKSFDEEGLKIRVCSMDAKRVDSCPPHLLVRQELKPGEILLGRITAFLHTSSLFRPVHGEDIRHTAEDTRADLWRRAAIQKRYVKCYIFMQILPGFTGRIW